jgi:hypothetical protein
LVVGFRVGGAGLGVEHEHHRIDGGAIVGRACWFRSRTYRDT